MAEVVLCYDKSCQGKVKHINYATGICIYPNDSILHSQITSYYLPTLYLGKVQTIFSPISMLKSILKYNR